MAFGLLDEFTMIALLLTLLCMFAANDAVKETVNHGSISNDDAFIYNLIKRIGGSNYRYQSEDPEDSSNLSGQQQTPHDGQQTLQPVCEPVIQQGSIIKTTESINAGADYIDSMKNVKSNDECLEYCCQNRTCDVAIYQDKGDRACYLFHCAGRCLFKAHSSYLVSTIKSRSSEHSEEDLQNLNNGELSHAASAAAGAGEEKKRVEGAAPSDLEKAENAQAIAEQTTQAVATTQAESSDLVIAPHSVGLRGFCTLDGQCEDPNAACGNGNCLCKLGFYIKEGLCRKVCQRSEFECFKLGTLSRGPECISHSQVCDSFLHCADGSDEFNCENMATNNQQNSWSQHSVPAPASVKGNAKEGTATDPYTESVAQEPASGGNQQKQQDSFRHIDKQNYIQSLAVKEHHVDANQQQNYIQSPDVKEHNVNINAQPDMLLSQQKPDVRPRPTPTQHAFVGQESNMHLKQNLYPGSALSQPAKPDLYSSSDNVRGHSTDTKLKSGHELDHSMGNPGQEMINPNANNIPALGNNPVPNQHLNQHQQQEKAATQASKPYVDNSPMEPAAQSNSFQGEPHQVSSMEESFQHHGFNEPQQEGNNQLSPQLVANPATKGQLGVLTPHGNNQDGKLRPVAASHTDSFQKIGKTFVKSDQHPNKPLSSPQKPAPPSSLSSSFKSTKLSNPHSSNIDSSLSRSRSKSPSHSKSHSSSFDQPSSSKSHDSMSMPSYSNSQKWLDSSLYMPYSLGDPTSQQQQQSQAAAGNQYFDSSQYYPPYSSDSLDTLPESLLESGGSPDELSQFGGTDVGQGRSLGLSYGGHNSVYQGYPDTSYGGRNPPSIRYDYNGDYRSPAYQDPDIYSSLGNQRSYRPASAGLYEDFPSGMRPPPISELQKVQDKVPHSPFTAQKIGDSANVAQPEPHAHDMEVTPHPTQLPVVEPSTEKASTAAPHYAATQKVFPESHDGKKHVFLSSEKVIIASTRTDAEGPIIALSLGLAFMVILLILVGCRLRNVRHRLRKGRPLHQNEADYLINGMYL